MSTPFGPQLIGETEKTLVALLRRVLEGTGLTEPEWVTLRVAAQLEGDVNERQLVAAVADRAHFPDAAELVEGVTSRGLIDAGQLTAAGRAMVTDVLARIEAVTGAIWTNLAGNDVAATTRVLNEIVTRARSILA